MTMSEYHAPVDHTDTQHEGTEHLVIDTLVHGYFTLLALRTAARLFKRIGPCAPISRNYIVKHGPFFHLTEAATLRLVVSKTSIPVPRVHCAFVHDNMARIVMERIDRESIGHAWKSLTVAQLKKIFSQLLKMFTELRAIQLTAGTGVESYGRGSLADSRIPHARSRFGPFKSIQEFHVWLREDFRLKDCPDHEDDEEWRDIKQMKTMQDR